jgi:hypothetical protein
LLSFVLSNCTWKGGKLSAAYRQPFDLLAKNVISLATKKPAEQAQTGFSDIWLPFADAYRTFCLAPPGEGRDLFKAIQEPGSPLAATQIG